MSESQFTADDIRRIRNDLLNKSDWSQLLDNGLTEAKRQEWVTYRQALRDFPATWTPSDTANFPNPPA